MKGTVYVRFNKKYRKIGRDELIKEGALHSVGEHLIPIMSCTSIGDKPRSFPDHKDFYNPISDDEAEIERLTALLRKHGVCLECGEMYEHALDESTASCECGCSEWGNNYTPYMELQRKCALLLKK